MISKRRLPCGRGFRVTRASMLFMEFLQKSTFLLSVTVLAIALPVEAQTMSSGIDLNALDKSVSPCTNFYQYACGTWMKNNPRPSDQARWTRFNELAAHHEEIGRKILEQAASAGAARSPLQQKIGDYYAACMDEASI